MMVLGRRKSEPFLPPSLGSDKENEVQIKYTRKTTL
jgi:hypothetical protein